MPNSENITRIKRSSSEARRIGKKGGIASGVARRRKKAMRELLEIALAQTVANPKTGEKKACDEWVAAALVRKAMKGDVAAYKTIAEMLGESSPMKIDMKHNSVQVSFAGMDVNAMTAFLSDVKEQAQQSDE